MFQKNIVVMNEASILCHIIGGEQNNGSTKKLRNRICIGYIERTSVGNTVIFHLFTLCNDRVNALVTMLSDSLCERIRE
jgi:hypothetical protein